MLIHVYDYSTLDHVGICSEIIRVVLERQFYSMGKFEIECSVHDEYINTLNVGNIVCVSDFFGIILYRSHTESSVTVKGYDLKYFCRARVVVPPFVYKTNPEAIDGYDRIKGDAETVIKHYADTQLINPSDTKRKIPNLICAENQNRGESIAWQAKFTKLDAEFESLCKYAKLGYDIWLDTSEKKFVFDVISGVNRTASQSDNAPVVFCREYKTVSDAEYIEDWLSAENSVYIGGNGEEESQFILTKSAETKAFLRIEGYTDISTNDTDEIDTGANAYLEEKKPTETVSGTANSRYRYKTDWNMGDYVTSRIKAFGSTMSVDEQIIGVSEVYERASTSVTPVFSDNNIIKKLLKG